MPTGPIKPVIRKKALRAIARMESITKEMNKPGQVKVGLPAGSNNYPDGTSVIMVGAVQEFGSLPRGIPERSYLRSTMHNNRRKYRAMLTKLGRGIAIGKLDATEVLSIMGVTLQGDVQHKIRVLKSPPNAPRTIEEKGSSNPLIDTGHLRQSIVWVVRKKVE